jgi:hypothetical protein
MQKGKSKVISREVKIVFLSYIYKYYGTYISNYERKRWLSHW